MKLQSLFCTSLWISGILCAIMGVDYGQEFSKVALIAAGHPMEIVLTAESKRKDLSGVSVRKLPGANDDLERVYGSAIGSLRTRFPQNTVMNFKPLLGKSLDDPIVADYLSMHFGSNLVASKNNRSTIAFDLGDAGVYSIEEIFAMGLSDIKLRSSAEVQSSTKNKNYFVDNIALSIPPFASQSQRLAYLDAAYIAELNVIGLVDEGISVAVNYVSSRTFGPEKEYHVVYDMGAGSTKATFFSVCSNSTTGAIQVDIEGVSYDETLGGQHFTRSVFQLLEEKFLASHPKYNHDKLNASPKALARLWESAEKAKIVLSANNEVRVSVESLFEDADFKAVVTRAEFEELNGDIMSRITKPIESALNVPLNEELEAPFPLQKLTSVLLTGGSTRIPFVQSHLLSLVGSDLLSKNINADEATVMGTTLSGVISAQIYQTKDIKVLERSLFGYEVQVGDQLLTVFPRGSKVGNNTILKLESLTNQTDDFTINTLESGHLLTQHDYSKHAKSVEKLNCSNGFEYFGSFSLDENRIFKLTKLEAKCIMDDKASKKGFFDKFLKGDTESSVTEEIEITDNEESVNATASATTSESSAPSANAIRQRKTTLSGKAKYPNSRPMGISTKESSIQKMRDLAKKDIERKERDEVKNKLEAKLYELRKYLSENDVVENCPEDILEESSELVSDYLEWLDFESDGADTKELKTRIRKLKQVKDSINKFLILNEADLSADAFVEIYNFAAQSLDKLSGILKNVTDSIDDLSKRYTEHGLNFTKESSKIKINFAVRSETEVEDSMKDLKSVLKELRTILEDTQAEAEERTLTTLPKNELFEIKENVTIHSEKVAKLYNNIADVHSRRTRLLTSKLERQIKKLSQEAAKSSATAAEAGSSTVEEGSEATEDVRDEL